MSLSASPRVKPAVVKEVRVDVFTTSKPEIKNATTDSLIEDAIKAGDFNFNNDNKNKSSIAKRIIFMLTGLTALITIPFYCNSRASYLEDKEEFNKLNSFPYVDSATYKWLEGYLTGDLDSCNARMLDSDVKLYNFYSSEESLQSSVSTDLYESLLQLSGDSIVSVKELSRVVGDDTVTFDIEVEYKDFEPISDKKYDFSTYEKVCTKYLDNSINLQEFNTETKAWIVSEFQEGIELSSDTQTLTVTLEEQEIGGYSYLKNASDLYLTLLEKQGAIDYMKEFEGSFFSEWNKSKSLEQ